MKKLLNKAVSAGVLSSFALASLTACGTTTISQDLLSNEMNQVNSFAKKASGKFTLALHMAADNNLYTAGLDDINEMEAGLASDDLNIIVLFDGSKQGDSKIYKIKRDSNGYDRNIISEVIDDKGEIIPASKEIDSGDPAVFNKFVNWVTKNYASEKNFIEIWNHGSGIYKAKTAVNEKNYPLNGSSFVAKPVKDTNSSFSSNFDRNFNAKNNFSSKSFASDDNGGEMQLRDLIPAMKIATGNLGRKVDIFGFDTCLMGHVETAYQLKDYANYLVASEELEPGDGWDYQAWFKALSANPGMSPAQIATSLVETYEKSYMPGGSQSGRDVTLSATDINALVDGLVPAINEMADELKGSAKPNVDKVRNVTQMFYNKDCADLGHFVSMMGKEGSTKANKVADEYKKTVLRSAKVGTAVSNASGLVIYFPKSTQYYNKRYDNAADIRFAEQPKWGSFLKTFAKI